MAIQDLGQRATAITTYSLPFTSFDPFLINEILCLIFIY